MKATASLALLSAAAPLDAIAGERETVQPQPARTPRVALFLEESFPDVEGIGLAKTDILETLKAAEVSIVSTAQLGTVDPVRIDVLITPYGSAFPLEGFDALLAYLKKGGNWINLGGVPLSVPVVKTAKGWKQHASTTAYHRKIGITQAFPVDARGLKDRYGRGGCETVYEFTIRCSSVKEFPEEDGSDGPRETVVRPFSRESQLCDAEGRSRAVPLLRIDQVRGAFAGGRWIFEAVKGPSPVAASLADFVESAALASSEWSATLAAPCLTRGEAQTVTINVLRPARMDARAVMPDVAWECFRLGKSDLLDPGDLYSPPDIDVHPTADDRNVKIGEGTLQLTRNGAVHAGSIRFEASALDAPGRYALFARQGIAKGIGRSRAGEGLRVDFWVRDNALLSSGKALTHDGALFLRDGAPYPVTGTTYMASDTHRRFLLEPNPAVWYADFRRMKKAGINLVRTGVWTGWSRHRNKDGSAREEVLRAFDAFLLTAKSFDIPVIFTFFAFLPEYSGCDNPFLDPRAVVRQARFVRSFVERYKSVPDLGWDFINEPSFCNPQQLWKCRPNYDAYEEKAWREWLRQSVRAKDDTELALILAERYRCAPAQALALPSLDDFSDANIFDTRLPHKAADYRFFAQEMFTRWAGEMAAVVREAAPQQLVTVGQDEGGVIDRPSPQFHHRAVDYTCVHTWWFNDDLLWDGLCAKVPGKPMLVEETGVMFYETIDGQAWRGEEDARDLVERKMALSLAADGAGFVEWIWNTNPYMPSDNEVAIGLHRIDGSAKPEYDALVSMAAFFRQQAPKMTGREDASVLMIIPHSQQFSARNTATEATRRAVRVMHQRCRVRMNAVSEYALNRVLTPPKLLLVPAPSVLTRQAFDILHAYAERGSTVLITGPFNRDEHWQPAQYLQNIGIDPGARRAVRQYETLVIGDATAGFSFRGEKMQKIEVETAKSAKGETALYRYAPSADAGAIYWSPVPVELAEDEESIALLYRTVLKAAGVTPLFRLEPDTPGLLVLPTLFREHALYAVVSELPHDVTGLQLTHAETRERISIDVRAGRTSLRMISRKR